jgi:hypothetical protein
MTAVLTPTARTQRDGELPAPATMPPVRRSIALVEPSPPAQTALRLFRDAKKASLQHMELLIAAVQTAQHLSDAVVEGGDLYDAGLHDLARRLSEDLLWKGRTLESLTRRQREAVGSIG